MHTNILTSLYWVRTPIAGGWSSASHCQEGKGDVSIEDFRAWAEGMKDEDVTKKSVIELREFV